MDMNNDLEDKQKINSKNEKPNKRIVNFENVKDLEKLRSNRALSTTRQLNKNLKIVKKLSQKNLLTSNNKPRFVGNNSISKSHEVILI